MKSKGYITFLTVIVFLSAANGFASDQNKTVGPRKMLISNNLNYSTIVDSSRKNGINIVINNLGNNEMNKTEYCLPFSCAEKMLRQKNLMYSGSIEDNASPEYDIYPLVWDIIDGYFLSIFVSDIIYSNKRGFGLIRIPLEEMKEIHNTQNESNPQKRFAPHLLKYFVDTLPISISTLNPESNKLEYFDFYAIDKDSIVLFALIENKLIIWQYITRQWKKIGAVDAPFKGSFQIVHNALEVSLLDKNGDLYLIKGLDRETENNISLKKMAEVKNANYIIDNKDASKVYLISPEKIIDTSRPTDIKKVDEKAFKTQSPGILKYLGNS